MKFARIFLAVLIVIALAVVGFAGGVGAGSALLAQHGAITAAAPAGVTISGPAADDQGKPGAWTCQGRQWLVGERFGDYSADNDTLGQPLPGDYLATIATKTQQRYYHAVFYSPQYGDLIVDYPFSSIATEAGTVLPTGRYDPVGKPSLSYNGGQLKIVGGLWGGGGGAADKGGRIYTWCGITP